MLYSNLNKIFCLLAALLSPSFESKSPLSDTDSNPKSPASYKKPVRPSLSIVFSRSNNKTDHTATLLTKPYLFSISFDNTQSTATISVHKPVTSQTKTAHLSLPQDNSLSTKITKPSLISMTFENLESTTVAPQSKPDVFSLSLNYDQSNAIESSKKTLALSNESVSRTITTESVHNKSEVEKETLKNDPRTTPEARRQYGQFGQPVLRPPSDAEIAQLLNEYKSMVSKYHYEEEQKIQDNIPFQDANVEAFSMNQKSYIQRQNLGYLGLRGATEMPSQGYRGVRPGGPGGNVPGRQGPGGHGPGGQGPGGQGPGGQGPGGQGPGGHEGPGGQGPGGHEGPGGHGPGGQGPGGHGPGGQGPGGHGPGGPGGPNTTPNEDAMAVATRFTTQRTTTRRRRRTAPKRWTFDENCDYTAYYCLRAFNTGSVCGKTIYYNHMTFKNYCMIEYVNCMERYDDYEYDNDDFLDRDYMVEDM